MNMRRLQKPRLWRVEQVKKRLRKGLPEISCSGKAEGAQRSRATLSGRGTAGARRIGKACAKFSKTALVFCLAVLFSLLLCLQSAGAEYRDGFAVTPFPWPKSGDTPVVRVNLYKYGKRQYLCLPSFWDTSSLYVYAPDASEGEHRVQGAEDDLISLKGDVPSAHLIPEQTMTIRDPKKKVFQSFTVKQGNLPALFIQTQTNSMRSIHSSRDVREPGEMVMVDERGQVRYSGALREVKARGNTTFTYPKKPYQIKLENKTDLLGTGEARTWVLLADYLDSSLLHNRITLDMSRHAGMRYAIANESVDLYMNGNYMGVYLLCEKPQIDPNRVAITDMQDEMAFLNERPLEEYTPFSKTLPDNSRMRGYVLDQEPEDITGGYLFEIDKKYRLLKNTKTYLFTAYNTGISLDEPEIAGEAQLTYLLDLLNAFERAIRAKDGTDPETGQHYSDIMDMESLAIRFLLEDISMNFDASAGSQFFYKDRSSIDPKLYAGPGWDYDLTYGILDKGPQTEYLTSPKTASFWYTVIYRYQPDFRALVAEIYHTKMRPALQILRGELPPQPGSPMRSLQSYHDEIGSSGAMNEILWPPAKLKSFSAKLRSPFASGPANLDRFLRLRMEALDRVLTGAGE